MSGKTVLVAWELGGGMGHINRLVPIASGLAARGYRIVFALRHVTDVSRISSALPAAPILRAPIAMRNPAAPTAKKGMAYNYADVLHRCGYDSKDELHRLVQNWRQLFDATRPSLLLCDHSPTAVLASSGTLPTVHIGSGFATPPIAHPFVPLHPASSAGAKEREQQVLEAIRLVQSRLGVRESSSVSTLLEAATNFACCLPELDPYRQTRVPPANGPTEELPSLQTPPEGQHVFGYLNGEDPNLPLLLRSLVKAKISGGVYVRQVTSECQALLSGTSLKLYDTPRKMPETLSAASAVLHHGGLATSEMALAVGRPQFIWSRNLEQGLTSEAIQSLGCGVNLRRQPDDPGLFIQRALRKRAYLAAAKSVSERLSERIRPDVREQIVASCLKYLT
jgi:UDP:flavonoid glycosyltransferase YjiC (YdhE family)